MDEKSIFVKHWVFAQSKQRQRYLRLINKYPNIEWTYKEKEYLLWLCNLDIDTLETFETIFEKLSNPD